MLTGVPAAPWHYVLPGSSLQHLHLTDMMQMLCAGNTSAAVPTPGAGSGDGASSAPNRKLLQGRLNDSTSVRQQYQGLTVAVVVYVTQESIFQAKVGPPLCFAQASGSSGFPAASMGTGDETLKLTVYFICTALCSHASAVGHLRGLLLTFIDCCAMPLLC